MRRLLQLASLLLLMLFPTLLLAQLETNVWAFGENALVDFNSGTAVSIGGSAIDQNEGCASIADRRTGALLFYTDGVTVWDRAHQPMPNGTGLNGDESSTQAAIIIPAPLNNFRYYVFTSDAGEYAGPNIGIHYSVVDMATNGGMGSVITKNVFLLRPAAEKLTAARHCNGRDYWVIAHRWESNQFYAWLVSPNGVSLPVVSAVGAVHRDLTAVSAGANTLGYMKTSPNGKKIAVALAESGIIELFDFDNLTGAISNPIRLTGIRNAYGLTFSHDNTKLYSVSSNYDPLLPPSDTLIQFDVTSGVATIIQNSRVNLYINNDRHFGALQMASDGKIYVGHAFFPMLGIIQSPNTAGLGCNYINNGLSLEHHPAATAFRTISTDSSTPPPLPTPSPANAPKQSWDQKTPQSALGLALISGMRVPGLSPSGNGRSAGQRRNRPTSSIQKASATTPPGITKFG
ncbi:MAG: hypothetical protein UZ07_CHB004002220 [Chlorobi bacterium OLB7]|nr:MAG: hypothetical protein UZ07_CHB004002220 [Chlorobi bacterium OLB7]